jgi:hypothetical protein
LCKASLPPHTPGTSDPDCPGLILRPVALPPFLCTVRAFILGEVAVGRSHHHVWLVTQDVLGPLYLCLSYDRHFCCVQEPASCAQVRLFAFPPPLLGAELQRERGSCSFL